MHSIVSVPPLYTYEIKLSLFFLSFFFQSICSLSLFSIVSEDLRRSLRRQSVLISSLFALLLKLFHTSTMVDLETSSRNSFYLIYSESTPKSILLFLPKFIHNYITCVMVIIHEYFLQVEFYQQKHTILPPMIQITMI